MIAVSLTKVYQFDKSTDLLTNQTIMKHITLLIFNFIMLTSGAALCQNQEVSMTPGQIRNKENSGVHFIDTLKSKSVKVGISLGYSALLGNLYNASISPIDNTLKLQNQFPANFLISTALVINPIKTLRVLEESNSKVLRVVGEQLQNISFVATVNLVSFGSSTETLFNKKIDGGLGIGYKMSDDFHIAFTAEMFSVKQLREYLIKGYNNQELVIDGKSLTAFDETDTRLFHDKYVPGFSLKFIYIIANKESNIKNH